MNRIRIVILTVAVFIVIGLIGIAIGQKAQSGLKGGDKTNATPIQYGVMTDRQRQHAKLFKSFGVGTKIIDLLKTQEEVSIVKGLPSQGDVPESPRYSLPDFLQVATCDAEAILTGIVIAQSSQLTAEGDFVFTDYTIAVESVLKNFEGASISERSNVVISRAGGAVLINGHLVTAVDRSAKLLNSGDKYLFFLKNIRSTGAFTTTRGTSLISGSYGKLSRLTEDTANDYLTDSTDVDAIALIRNSVEKGCSPALKGAK